MTVSNFDKMSNTSRKSSFVVLFGLIVGVLSGTPEKHICTSVAPDCNGNQIDCSRSIPCYHGDCDGSGGCLCQSCWRGEHCNEYVDKYPPQFLVKSKYIALSSFDSGSLFVAEAVDADAGMTCHFDDVICPCSSIRYSIQSGNEYDLFTINSQSGHVFVTTGAHLTVGVEYSLVIRASSLLADFNISGASRRTHDDMQVTLRVDDVTLNRTASGFAIAGMLEDEMNNDGLEEAGIAESVFTDEDKDLIRNKRSGGTEKPSDTIMTLTLLESSEKDKVYLGGRATYKLEILLPKVTDMDLTVELFTNDPEDKNSTFRICDARVTNVGSSVKSDLGDMKTILPEMIQNPTEKFDDRAIFNFSKVTNDEDSDNTSRVIEIVFSAVLVKSATLKNSAKYYITAGAEYDNENFVWVGQSEMQAVVPAEQDKAYDTTFSLTGEDSIPEDEARVYTIKAGVTYPLETVILDVFAPDDNHIDLFSVGNLRLKDAGTSFSCIPQDKLIYPMTFFTTETGKSKYRGTLDLGEVSNCAKDRSNPENTTHMLTLEFAIHILKGTKGIIKDGNLTFASGLLIGQKTIWTAITNITVDPYNPNPDNKGNAPKLKLVKPNSAITMPEKGVTLIRYALVFDFNTFTDTNLLMEVSDKAGISLCSVQVYYRGFNIPFIPILKYEFTDGSTPKTSIKATVDFGRIQTTDQVANNETANSLILDIGVRSTTTVVKEKLKITVSGNTVESPVISTEAATVSSDVILTFSDVLGTDKLFENAETGVDMEFTFPLNSPFEPFELEVMGQFGPDSLAARICRVEVTHVGRLMPCVNKTKMNEVYEYTTTMDSREITDRAIIPFERLCASSNVTEDAVDLDRKMLVNFVAELPKQSNLKKGAEYWLNAGIKMGPEHVLAGSVKYVIEDPDKGSFKPGMEPLFEAYGQDGDGPLVKGSKYVFFHFKLPPRTRADYKLTMEISDAGISLCSLRVIHIGHNMPCVYRKMSPGSTDAAATTKLTYTPTAAADPDYYTKGEIDFGSLANVGVDPLITSRRNDRNTILVGAGIHVIDRSKNYKVKYTFTYGGKSDSKDVDLVMGAEPTPGEFTTVVMDSLDGTKKIYDGVTTIVYVDFKFPAYVTTDTVDVAFTKTKGSPNIEFCSAAVTFVGYNMPCVDVTRATVVPAGEELTINLGKVCHTNAFEDSEESRIRVEMAFNAPDGASATIQAEVKIADQTQKATVDLANDKGPPPKTKSRPFLEKDVTLPPADLKIPVSQKKWIPVKMVIPTNATLKFNITVEGAFEGDRAILTLYDVMVGDAGINLACMRNGSFLVPELTKSDDVKMKSQNNVMKVDFGYITNTGFSDKRGDFREGDNDVTVLFLVRMTDHPKVEDKAIFPLTINVQADDTVVTLIQNLTATRDGKEKEKFDFNITLLEKKDSYNKGDALTMNVLISHSPDSSLEPTTVFLRILAPPFVGYKGDPKFNMTSAKKSDTSYFQLEVNRFLFDDVLNVEIVVEIDPNNKRKPGSPATTATMIIQGVCNVTSRATFQYPTKFHYCTPQFTQSMNIGAAGGCNDDLTKVIQDCQLSASSAMDDKKTPALGRTNGDTYWAPAFRLGKMTHYYQVDFGNTTMVVQLKIKKIKDMQPIATYSLSKSSNGRIWKSVSESVNALYDKDDTFTQVLSDASLQTRFLRITVVKPEYNKASDTSIAAQFQFDGCAVGGGVTPEAVCQNQIRTRISNNASEYRHFVVGDKEVMLVCDYIPNKDKMNCFCSETKGKTWQGLPPNIGSLVGYDTAEKAVYALDKKGRSYMKYVSCKKWTPLKDPSLAKSSNVIPATVVPAQNSKDLKEVTNGTWTAKFEGLFYGNKKCLDWSICCK